MCNHIFVLFDCAIFCRKVLVFKTDRWLLENQSLNVFLLYRRRSRLYWRCQTRPGRGCITAPILVRINMQAAFEVIKAHADYLKLQYKTREDHLFAGRPLRTRKDVESFEFSSSLIAGDGAFLSKSRDQLHKAWAWFSGPPGGLDTLAMWTDVAQNRRRGQCVFRPQGSRLRMLQLSLSKSMVVWRLSRKN